MKTILNATIILAFLTAGDASAQRLDSGDERGKAERSRRVSVEMGYANMYESNVNHDLDALPSRGSVPSLGLTYRNRPDKPTFEVVYVGARHAYTNTDRWDRFSNLLRAEYSPEIKDWLRLESSAEVSLKGSSEDRDLSDQVQYRQEVEFRPVRSTRLHVYGTARIKRYDGEPERDAFKPNAGFVFEQKFAGDRSIEVDTRYEINRPRTPRSRYDRWTVEVEYETPGFTRQSELELKFKRRWKSYDRVIELENGDDAQRRDHRWSAGVSYEQTLFRRVRFVVEYEYETRHSNDTDKLYDAHLVMTGLTLVL